MTFAIVFGVLQTCIVTHESNGIDIITALILNDISPLCRYQMEMVLQLKVCRCSLWLVGSVDRRLTFLPVVLTKLLNTNTCAILWPARRSTTAAHYRPVSSGCTTALCKIKHF